MPRASSAASSTVVVQGATFLVNASIAPTAVDLTSGGLGGSGTVGPVNATGGTVAPGTSPGLLIVNGNYTMAAPAVLSVEIGGQTAGTAYDQVRVQGDVALGNAMLPLTLTAAPAPGFAYVIIDNLGSNPVNGTFSDLLEGQTVGAVYNDATYTFVVSYAGNDGNDVVLTETLPRPRST